MASFVHNNQYAQAFGYKEFKTADLKEGWSPLLHSKFPTKLTLANALCWIPVIGNIIGIIHTIAGILLSKSVYEADRKVGHALIGRGISEILGLGPLMTIADIAFTVARKVIAQPSQERIS